MEEITNNSGFQKEKPIWFQLIAIFTSCLSSMTMGLLFSWSSPSIPKITRDPLYDITLDEASYFTVIPSLGMVLSSVFYPLLADKIGRKWTILSSAFWYITSYLLIATTRSVYTLYTARFLSGIGDGVVFTVLPMYIGEICTPKVRGTYGNFLTLSIYFGQFLINIFGSFTSIKTAAWIGLCFPLTFLTTYIFMPESPYFYLIRNRIEEARIALRTLRQTQNVEEELVQIQVDVKRQMSESGTWKDLFLIKVHRRGVLSGVFLRLSQQLGGISSLAVYTQYLFAKSEAQVSASTSSIIFMGLTMVLNACAGATLDVFGRRKSYFYSLILTGLSLVLLSAFFYIDQFHPSVDLRSFSWIPLVLMVLYTVTYSFGLGIVPTQMMGELFSASIKSKGMCCLTITFALSVSIVTKLFQILDTTCGTFSTFLFFAVFCFLSAPLALFVVPETEGKTLEEIQQSMKAKK